VGTKLLSFGVLSVILVESKKKKSVTLLSVLKAHSTGDIKILLLPGLLTHPAPLTLRSKIFNTNTTS
jgi:hypothetical protein